MCLSYLQRHLESSNSSELLCLPEPDNRKIIMPQQSFDFFETADTASLAALVVAEGSASDYGPSGF